jgi:hypothetical protein
MPENIHLYTRNGWSEIGRTETKVSMKKNAGLKRPEIRWIREFLSDACGAFLAKGS